MFLNRGVPGRVPAGTNGTSRPFCPGAGTSRQMPNWPEQTGQTGQKKVLCSIGATNYNIEIILFFPLLLCFSSDLVLISFSSPLDIGKKIAGSLGFPRKMNSLIVIL